MTEQFEWAKGGLGSLTYLVEPALGWKNGNVTVKTSAGTTGHVGISTTSSTVSGPRSSRTKNTSPSGSCSDCFRCCGRLHPLRRVELTTPASVRARRERRGPAPRGAGGGRAALKSQVCACASFGSERLQENRWNSGAGDLELSGEGIGYSMNEKTSWGPRVVICLSVWSK